MIRHLLRPTVSAQSFVPHPSGRGWDKTLREITKWRQTLLRSLCLSVVAVLLLAPVLQAGDPDVATTGDGAQGSAESTQPNAVTADDGGSWEVGLHGSAGNLTTATAAERAGMRYWLDNWFVTRYNFNEATAWERDFKRAALGGTENSYIDSVDLQFYVGHGAPGLFTFDNASYSDSTLSASNDCNTTWGDGDNEWLALTSCQVLADSAIGQMAQCMNRQHLILGFVTNASAHNSASDTQAYHFGRYMRYGYNMTQSWFKACDVAQRGRTTRVIAEETACFNDNPYYGSVCADTIDSDYYWYTHNCGTESASSIPLAQLADELPIYKVAAYSTDQAVSDYQSLGEIFSIPVSTTLQAAALGEDPNPPAPPGTTPFFVSTNLSKTLEMDKGSGIYNYSDLSQLWTDNQAQQALAVNAASANYINNDDARRIADAFLAQHNLTPADGVFYEVVSDTVGSLAKNAEVSAASIVENETPSMWQVIYTRKLTVPVVMASGVSADLSFTVVGPGAKQKVYVPLTGQVNAAGALAAEPVGVQGGWRDVEPLVNAASGEQVMTTIIDAATARALYLKLDKAVTMNSIPLDVKSREILSETLAYWENAPGSSQGELVPVYELTVKFTEKNTDAVSQDLVYLPASPQYMHPYAQILNAPTTGVDQQSQLTLSAADASKTLKALGVGDAFDFVMGYNGAAGTYTYEWYLGSVAPENKITDLNTNDGATNVTFTVPQINGEHGNVVDVILVVKDIESPNAESTGSASVTAQLTVNSVVFMPLVNKP